MKSSFLSHRSILRLACVLALVLFADFEARAQKWEPIYAPFDSLAMLCEQTRNHITPVPENRAWLKEMHAMADKRADKRLKWRALFWDAWYYDGIGRDDIALEKVTQAMAMADSARYPYDWHRLLWMKTIAEEQGDLIKINRIARSELKYYERIGDKLMTGVMWLNIGRLYDKLKVYDKALDCSMKYEQCMREIGFEGAATSCDPMIYYLGLGDTVKAREVYLSTLAYATEHKDTLAMMAIYTMANVQRIDTLAGFEVYRLAELTPHRLNAHYFNAYINMGYYYLTRGDYEKSLELYQKAERESRGANFPGLYGVRLSSIGGVGYSYKGLGQLDSALTYIEMHFEMMDSLNRLNGAARYQEMYERVALEREEEHIAQEQAKARNRLIFIVLGFSLLLLAAVAALYYMHSRRRLKEAENKELEAKVEAERLQRELYQAKNESNERELTTNSLLLIEKKKMIDQLNRRIEEGADDGKIDDAMRRDLQNFIRIHQGTEEGLSKFYDYFNNVHPDFFRSLKERYPDLTKGDLRLCAYLRMGLDSKQIAQILSLQPDAIKKARYRLRKKFGLPAGASLEEFLMG